MNNKQKHRIIVYVAILLAILTFAYLNNNDKPASRQVCSIYLQKIHEIVQDGDIITRLGDRLWSDIIRDKSVEDKRFSHVGVVRVRNEQISVVHAEGTTVRGNDFVKEEPLEDFLQWSRAIGIYRVGNICGIEISNLSIEYIGIPFDWRFDLTDETTMYCTELIKVIFGRLNPEIVLSTVFVKELGREIIPLESISNSEFFEEIITVGVLRRMSCIL